MVSPAHPVVVISQRGQESRTLNVACKGARSEAAVSRRIVSQNRRPPFVGVNMNFRESPNRIRADSIGPYVPGCWVGSALGTAGKCDLPGPGLGWAEPCSRGCIHLLKKPLGPGGFWGGGYGATERSRAWRARPSGQAPGRKVAK